MKCREWYDEKAKENLRAGLFGIAHPCIDVVELKRNKCPKCGWTSKYDEDGFIIKAEDREGTLQELEDYTSWYTKNRAEMKIRMDMLDAQHKAELAESSWDISKRIFLW